MKTQFITKQENGKYILFLGGLVLGGILFLAANAFAAGVVVGEEAPDFTAFTTTGEKLSLSDLQGETVFMAFWSTWCSRSREELAYLKELSERYPSLVFVAVNSETEATGIKSLVYMRQAIEEYELPVAIVVDRGMKIWNQYDVTALPTSLIISADGHVLFSEPNFFWVSARKFEKVLDDMYAVSLNLW
jgi:peroxiredoxin